MNETLINPNIFSTLRMLSAPDKVDLSIEEIMVKLEEAIDLKLYESEVFHVVNLGYLAISTVLLGLLVAKSKAQLFGGIAASALVIIGGAITIEILINDVFVDEIKRGLLEDFPLFNSVFLSPVIPPIAVGIVGFAIGAGVVALIAAVEGTERDSSCRTDSRYNGFTASSEYSYYDFSEESISSSSIDV